MGVRVRDFQFKVLIATINSKISKAVAINQINRRYDKPDSQKNQSATHTILYFAVGLVIIF